MSVSSWGNWGGFSFPNSPNSPVPPFVRGRGTLYPGILRVGSGYGAESAHESLLLSICNKVPPAMTDAQLARALPCNRSTILRYRRRGMPTDNVDVARRWIALNVRRGGPPRGVTRAEHASLWLPLQTVRAELREIKALMRGKRS